MASKNWVKNPAGRIVRACTVHTVDTDPLFNSIHEVISESEKLCLSDEEWKIRYQRPNAYFKIRKKWTQCGN